MTAGLKGPTCTGCHLRIRKLQNRLDVLEFVFGGSHDTLALTLNYICALGFKNVDEALRRLPLHDPST